MVSYLNFLTGEATNRMNQSRNTLKYLPSQISTAPLKTNQHTPFFLLHLTRHTAHTESHKKKSCSEEPATLARPFFMSKSLQLFKQFQPSHLPHSVEKSVTHTRISHSTNEFDIIHPSHLNLFELSSLSIFAL